MKQNETNINKNKYKQLNHLSNNCFKYTLASG